MEKEKMVVNRAMEKAKRRVRIREMEKRRKEEEVQERQAPSKPIGK